MKKLLFHSSLLLFFSLNLLAQAPPNYDKEVEALLAKMTIEEKIGQMTQVDLLTVVVPNKSPIQLDPTKLREAVVTYKISSFINNGLGRALSVDEWRYVNKTIQDMILKETPNKIPLLYGIDAIHGSNFTLDATLFPQSIGMGATRNPELARRAAEITAMETRASGLRWNFAPVLDVARQPLWSRLPESYGEDPHLVSVMGAAAIRGMQRNDVGSPTSVAACMKHFLTYSFPMNGKDRSPALMPEHYLREYFLPPFREAVKAGVKTVMINSGEVNGMPVHGSKYLLTTLLREELGFEGVAVSDWEDVIRLHTWHAVADSPKEAVRLAVDAGLDMSMVPLNFSFFTLLKELVQEGKISEKRIDQSVRRILKLKYETGLFKNPYLEKETAKNFGKPEYRQTALAAANEVMTLLKNSDNTLPLAKNRKVLVAGPAAHSITALNGCWSYTWQGNDPKWYPKNALTIADAIREMIGAANVSYRQGVDFTGKVVDVDQAVADATTADVVILCLGEDAYAETPGDINELDLPAGQQELARKLYATGKPVVLVLVEGRGRIIRDIEPQAKGILMAYWPGLEGGRAVANVLFGDVNPSGKLPFTYQQHANNLLTYDRKYTNRLNESSAPGEFKIDTFGPQYEFGHGLSYTTFVYRDLKLSSATIKGNGKLTVSVEVVNTGTRNGMEAVELYTRDLFASLTPPLRRLRAFKKVNLKAKEITTVSFDITREDLAFVNQENKLVTEPGSFEVMIGKLKAEFKYEE